MFMVLIMAIMLYYYDSSLSHQVAVMLPICTFILRILLAAQVFACVQSELGIRDLFIDSASLGHKLI